MTIRNDATRQTVRAADPRRPRSVVARQGQVLLDADVNQQATHLLDRVETGSRDTVGSDDRFVVPAGSSAFQVSHSATPQACGIGVGHGYLGGWLVENTTVGCTLATQPHPRTDTEAAGPPFLLALKALVRHIDPVEEPAYADPALGDAQASGRALVDWQVFPFVPKGGWGNTSPTCASVTTVPEWAKLVAPSTGTFAVQESVVPTDIDPCSLAPAGGYSRAENLLYRIEVHGGVARQDFPDVDGPRYGLVGLQVKMSRRNASILARITRISGTEIVVEPACLDPLNWFAPGAYAEVVSPHDDLYTKIVPGTGRLFRVVRALDDVVTLENNDGASIPDEAGEGWYLRRWDAFPDGRAVVTVIPVGSATRSQPIDLGDGLKAYLGAGVGGPAQTTFRRGDYWTFAVRADGSVDWPKDPEPREETPHGPLTRYAPLAVVPAAANNLEECRIPLATLTDRALLYRGGDGQNIPEASGGGWRPLPAKLRVAVMRGNTPVNGAAVRWSRPTAANPQTRVNGTVVGPDTVTLTTLAGLCEVTWEIDASQPGAIHQVQAELLSPSGTPEGKPIVFTASFLGEAEPDTLMITSIDLKFSVDFEAVHLVDRDGFILNGLTVPYDAFMQHIAIGVTGSELEANLEDYDPIVEVELDLPYPTTDDDRRYWARASRSEGANAWIKAPFGFRRVRLDGSVELAKDQDGSGLMWTPSDATRNFLDTIPSHRCGHTTLMDPDELNKLGWDGDPNNRRILCRLRVRSAHVWGEDEQRRRVYLNAEHLGVDDGPTERDLLLSDRDPQRAADLDMFFYLDMADANHLQMISSSKRDH